MKNITLKGCVVVILAMVCLSYLLYACASDARIGNSEATEASTETATESATESATEAGSETAEEAEEVDENGFTEEEKEAYINAANSTFDDNIEKDISIADDVGEQQKKIGNYYVDYNGSYATSGMILLDTYRINMIIYNDGSEDDVKGYVLAYPLMENMEKPTTVEQCQSILSELIPAGTGFSAVWEETDQFFIRMLSGYSADESASVISYIFVPKRIEEGNVYQVILTASKSGSTITPISEESFNSAVNMIADAVSDSKIFTTDYESVKESLVDVAYYETSTSDSVGGLTELAKAHRNYLETVYGTTDLDSLTEEEIDEAYWKYMDPRGYAEYQYYENGIGELDEDGNVVVSD